MTSWLWQQYTAAAAAASSTDQFAAAAGDSLQPAAVDAMTNGTVIVYHLNADGTQSATYAAANSVPASSDVLEPGEVRLPVTARQTNGAASDQLYSNTGANAAGGVGVDYQSGGSTTPWLRQISTNSSIDSEKQLLRGALVDKVREIQRLTRELEQAYALIHQLKQHSEFLHRQWGQMHVASDATQ